jgi:hypothetical protein
MTKRIRQESQIIRGFEAEIADANFYKKVAEGSAKKFGRNSRAYQTIMNGINTEEGKGSQVFFNTEANLYLPEKKRIARFDDLSRIYSVDPTFFENIYAESQDLILRSDKPSRKNNSQILENLVAQVRERGLHFSSENPIVLSNLELIEDSNENNLYGILLKIGDSTKIKNDSRFAHGKRKIDVGEGQKNSFTIKEGLSRTYFDGYGDVNSDYGDLRSSNDGGRVVVFDEAEGVGSESLTLNKIEQKYRADLTELRDKINAKLSQ